MTVTTDRLTEGGLTPIRNISMKEILKTLPAAYFQKDRRKAWSQALLSVVAAALGYVAIANSPWFLLPVAWIFTGTALTGWFVIGHDCGHRSFAKRRWVNDLVGHVFFLPLIYPFHSWRLLHDHHHLHTNEQGEDNAWFPWEVSYYLHMPALVQWGYRVMRGSLWWMASIVHWAMLHFDPAKVAPRDRNKVKLSAAVVIIFAAIVFPTLIIATGFWGFVKFWLMPWLVYHFWMSTFTLVHHTDPEIPFRPTDTWNAAEAQLSGTVHCDYPRWVEILCHDINVHIPHHLSTGIPSYNLRSAHHHIKGQWEPYLRQEVFSWALIKRIIHNCHLYHPEQAYQRFKDLERAPF
jgi:omega-6 fatty acid desaturase (delta-12 desaturase)